MRATLSALLAAAAWATAAWTGGTEAIERLTIEARYALRPAPGYTAPLAVIAIDERSIGKLGQMPWDRRVFARLLDRLHDAGVQTVGIDVAFNEPARDPREDEALAAAIARTPTVLPTFLAYADAGHDALTPIDPLAPFTRAAAGIGSVQLSSKPQAEIWEMEPYQDTLTRRVPAFPLAVARAYAGAAWSPATLGLPWRSDPTYIDYRGPANSAPMVSAIDVLEGKADPARLAGKIALVGAVAAGMPDTNFAVPDFRGGPMSGIEIDANVVDNALGGGGLKRLHPGALALLLGLLALAIGPWLTRGDLGGARRGAALGLATAAWAIVAALALPAGIWLDFTPVAGFLATAYAVGLFAERTYLLRSRNHLLARYAQDLAAEARRQRARIEGELHDGIQQILIVIGREIRQIQKQAVPPEAEARVDLVRQLTETAQSEIKRLRADLLPPALRYGDLVEALPGLAEESRTRGGLDVQVEVLDWQPLAREREVELYWLVKEALNNAEKHAAAKHVQIKLSRTSSEAVIEVKDDGNGFTVPDLSLAPTGIEHSGLHRMWLRMRGNDGDLRIASAPGSGTNVRLSLSVDARRYAT